jgi:hypothetical protein
MAAPPFRLMRNPDARPDRGMIRATTIVALEARGLLDILGVREWTDKLVREVVLRDTAPFVPLTIEKRGKGPTRAPHERQQQAPASGYLRLLL